MKPLFFAAIALSLSSCLNTPEDKCVTTITTPILTATGPRTLTLGQSATFSLTYPLENSCGKYTDTFDQTQGNTRYVGIHATYNGCACAAVITNAQVNYTFQPTQASTYYLKFLTTNNAYITDTLVVK